MEFSKFFEHQLHIDRIIEDFNSLNQGKVWSAKKSEIIQTWRNLRQDIPINITPVSKEGNHKTYGEDGIRITGSWPFIASVLSRLKEILSYENPKTRLNLVLKGVSREKMPNRQAFVFYLNLEPRGKSKI